MKHGNIAQGKLQVMRMLTPHNMEIAMEPRVQRGFSVRISS